MITITLKNEGNMLRTELPKPLDDLEALNSLCGRLYKGFDDAFKAEIINESNARGVHDLKTLFGTDIPFDKNSRSGRGGCQLMSYSWFKSRI